MFERSVPDVLGVPNPDIRSTQMNIHTRFGTTRENTSRELTISRMLSDLVLSCELIEADIAAEEQRTGIFDPSDKRYPILARSLTERHRNLKGTIAALERRR
ncbi:hypothetical protein [Bradyrhizobium jicamae]|uniref:hypothetical protein n=1 Tax=Bradyrhizobium jicamae TaxID=280332 RepID=UPI0028987E15|nr:hypothetical protein [Bradyrhizobium jicamae]